MNKWKLVYNFFVILAVVFIIAMTINNLTKEADEQKSIDDWENIGYKRITKYNTYGKDTINSYTTYLTYNKKTLDTLFYSFKMNPYISKKQSNMSNSLKLKEELFYKKTTKRELFLILEQFAELLKDDEQHWTDKAKEELVILKINNIE